MTPIEWLMSGDTGISSETICAVMTGSKKGGVFGADIPHDVADFGRCYRLLKNFPEWRDNGNETCPAEDYGMCSVCGKKDDSEDKQ